MIKVIQNFKFTPATIALMAMNLIPLIGVVKFGWDAGTIVFLYWLENVIIGILNIPKIMTCRGGLTGEEGAMQSSEIPGLQIGLMFLAGFFTVHYGIFCFGHYSFIEATYRDLPSLSEMPAFLSSGIIFWSLLGLTLSHVISMVVNFYGRGEYLRRSPGAQMFLPYTRIVVLHMVIIFGGFLAMAMGEGIAPLVMLVIIKIIVDLGAHTAEHSGKKSWLNPGVGAEEAET